MYVQLEIRNRSQRTGKTKSLWSQQRLLSGEDLGPERIKYFLTILFKVFLCLLKSAMLLMGTDANKLIANMVNATNERGLLQGITR